MIAKAMRSSAREAVATLREMVLMPWDLTPRLSAERAQSPDERHTVVLVHGFLATAGVFRPLRARLLEELAVPEGEQVHVASFTHAPGMGVHRIAEGLARLCARIPGKLHLVGHSLGGVVARYYVQELGGDRHVEQTISLASPFFGTSLALPVLVGRDLRRDSKVLVRLRNRADAFRHVPHLSLVAKSDVVVRPYQSANFPTGDAVELAELGHNTLLYDRGAQDRVIARLRERWFYQPSTDNKRIDHTPKVAPHHSAALRDGGAAAAHTATGEQKLVRSMTPPVISW